MSGSRMLILGLDGATWKVADPLIEAGKLPHLAQFKKKGTWAWLNSTNPPMTLPSWSSMLTGCSPGKHGIFDFVQYENQKLKFVNSTDRAVPTIHQILSKRGGRVASLLVPTTWPPQPINGVVVSGFDSPVATDIDASFCEPPTIYTELQRRFGGVHFADLQESNIGDGWHAEALPKLLKEIERKTAMGEWLLKQERWDCFMLLFGESDTVSHHFWMFHDPESPRYIHKPELSKAILHVYQRLDDAVGRLIDRAKPDWVCICSDHGFGGAGEHVLYLNRFLEQHGWLRYGNESSLASLRRNAARIIPHSLLGQIFRKIPGSLRDRLEARARYGGIVFDQTRAFSDEMNYSATIRMPNMAGFGRLRQQLLDWVVDGQHPVRNVYTREELYHGEMCYRSPEIVLELNYRDGYSYTVLSSGMVSKGEMWRKMEPFEHYGGKGLGMNGSHRQYGVLGLYGTDVQCGEITAGMEDITPTLLHLMGEAIPSYMDGQVCAGSDQIAYSTEEDMGCDSIELTKGEAHALQKRLQKLGYL